jgi:hypothetical protein
MQSIARFVHRSRLTRALGSAALVLALVGCFASPRQKEADAKAQAAYARCDQMLGVGKIKTHLAAVDCAVPAVVAAYGEAGYAFTDLTYISIQARRIGAAKIDNGEVSEAEYRHDLAELETRIAAEDARRRDIMRFGGNPQPVPVDTLVQGLSVFAQTPTAAEIPAPPPGTGPACLALGAIRPCK